MAIPTFRLVEKAAPDEVLPRLILVDGDRQQRAAPQEHEHSKRLNHLEIHGGK